MMKKIISSLSISLFVINFSINNAFAKNKATIIKIKNKVEYKESTSNSWNKIEVNQTISPVTSIRTGPSSKVEFMFEDGTVTRLGSQSFFTLLGNKNRSVKIQLGRLWFDVKKNLEGFKFQSPTAVAAITGTEGFIEFSGEATGNYIVEKDDTLEIVANKILGEKSSKEKVLNLMNKIVKLNPNKVKMNKYLYEKNELVLDESNLNKKKQDTVFSFGLIEGTSDISAVDSLGNLKSEVKKVKEGELLVLKNGVFSIKDLYENIDIPKNMVVVKGSSFDMGGKGEIDEIFIHKVNIRSFFMSKYEITQKEYKSIMKENPSKFKGENLPVENVSWFDAIKFCNKKSISENLPIAYDEKTGQMLDSEGNITNNIKEVIGYRLPTEAEWEYASRGGKLSKKYIYSGSNSIDDISWYGYEISNKTTHEVGKKKSNELGIFDMSGNVSEWVYDTYLPDAYKKIETDTNPYLFLDKKDSYKVYRGGSWDYIEKYHKVFTRGGYLPEYKNDNIGFRIVKNISFL